MSGLPESVATWRNSGRFVDLNRHSIFTRDAGAAGPHVLILHGFPASSFDWRNVVLELAGHARVVTFDFLGYGLSDKPIDPRVTLFQQADLAERVAALHGIERCLLVAHDMGDSVAAELMMRQNEGRLPFAIDQVVLTNGSIFIDLANLSDGQKLLLALPDEPLADPLPLEGFRSGIAATFSHEHQPSDEEVTAMIALIAHNGGDRLLPRLIRYIEERRQNQQRWTAGLVEFKGPLSVCWGKQDPIAVIDMVHHLKTLRDDIDVTAWADVGHWPALEVPARLADAIHGHL